MLVSVKDANEDIRESCKTASSATVQPSQPTTINESNNDENGYPFVKEEEDVWPQRKAAREKDNQLAIRIQYDKVTIEFFGHSFYTSRDFAVFMDKVGGKHVSSR